MRVYLPATFSMLATLAEAQKMPVRSGVGFALTQAVRDFYTEGDDEELAYTAFLDAAQASLRLLATAAADGGEGERFPHRRVVISADIPDANVTPEPSSGESVVRLRPAEVTVRQLAAIHVDDADAEAATAKAVEAIDAADLGDEDAQLLVGDCEDNLMSWYDARELGVLVELL